MMRECSQAGLHGSLTRLRWNICSFRIFIFEKARQPPLLPPSTMLFAGVVGAAWPAENGLLGALETVHEGSVAGPLACVTA
jgi:hypothetical protein